MKVSNPTKEVRALCESKNLKLTAKEIDIVLDSYQEHIFYNLERGEDFRIRSIGKITPIIFNSTSKITGEEVEYDTVKFKFTVFGELKKAAKDKVDKIQKK